MKRFVPLLVLALTACQSTSFQNLPPEVSTTCPKPLVGAWLALDDGDVASDFGLVVKSDCTVESLDDKGVHRPASARPQLTLAKIAGDDVFFVPINGAVELVDVKAEKNQTEGQMAFAWKRTNMQLDLRGIDDRRVSTLIVQGAIQGESEVQHLNRGTNIYNFVKEDSAGTERVIGQLGLFQEKATFHFRRVGDDMKALERALKTAAKKPKK